MKKIFIAAIACLSLGSAACYAGESTAVTTVSTTATAWYHGFYKAENGSWMRIFEDGFVRIDGTEYDYTTGNDQQGNLVLTLTRRGNYSGCITIFSDRTAIYNGTSYRKS